MALGDADIVEVENLFDDLVEELVDIACELLVRLFSALENEVDKGCDDDSNERRCCRV